MQIHYLLDWDLFCGYIPCMTSGREVMTLMTAADAVSAAASHIPGAVAAAFTGVVVRVG